ncbi:DNA mismatch repair endonuclease MutL [Staphylococcus epidermidis]|jgi:DNA mismatch repair protein MutL|uniref:DNA mismatch repair protein MutL n=5 Tax=Staphylococcus TaxID=1279 RepID=MUTL_STAEQ|nr:MULTISPECIES: DNA mismatch repair endonuclease MutL [Staphylococcus]Q5HPP4.1 RecName: Full=DNA mismatch repair protein MutL [Staphylococcus epidermidis RP62A]Q8CPE9.1 RecName: Full=DNA mismatch repair protein MutL [Staphylococcus epidermidis ATCC 12228]EHQ74850.1 DNA mismatch repair protein [Staphylococcus epidermidis VCU057]AAO04572.1 DNA mismatch repair protein [Staphylococcus epidermidis ATCC 12228]AAW54255.1 DNA mismatch repair protein HexB [Staphylococcus epidermidis RP62A]ARG66776.1 
MGKIKELETSLANKIAAGEVVERPSSVVKELLENAIDAQATEINIEVEQSGVSSIRVVDNGTGIAQEDLGLVFHRHATSKIVADDDLFHIRTLGFRGEALASISSVAKVTLKTCTDNENGHEIYAENGKIIHQKPAKAKKGTDIQVDSLFYNTPARLKYIKSLYTELGKITDIVNRMAMSHPEIRISLVSDGKKLLSTNGSGRTNEVMAEIYGMKVAKDLVHISGDTSDYHLEGFVAKPEHSRSNKHYISIFINGRYIKNFVLNKAILEGYHTLLTIGRFPICYINIQMDPILVDVNVHPTKLEVRLSKEDQLYDLIVTKIREAFKDKILIPQNDLNHASKKNKVLETFEQQKINFEKQQSQIGETSAPYVHDQKDKNHDVESHKNNLDSTSSTNNESTEVSNELHNHIDDSYLQSQKEVLFDMEQNTSNEYEISNQQSNDIKGTVSQTPHRRVPYMEIVGQVHGTYIIAQNENGMFMIDQHAAQERIKYEYFREKIGEVTNEVQNLLIPLTFHFSKDEQMIIDQYKDELDKVGVHLEHFGGHDYIVNSYPVWFPKEEAEEIIKDMIELVLKHKSVDVKKIREDAAIMMSCKKSIKANHYLKNNEMADLIDQLREAEDPFTCPHGRPIIINFSNYELEKLFKRVM